MKNITKAIVKKAMVAVFAVMGVMAACAELTREDLRDDNGNVVGYKVAGLGNDEVALVFTTAGEEIQWTVPANLENVQFLAVGGGGAGGGAADYSSNSTYHGSRAGAGGGGGGVVTGTVTSFTKGDKLLITIGKGGGGGAYANSTSEGAGAVTDMAGDTTVFVGETQYIKAGAGGSDTGYKTSGGQGASNSGSRNRDSVLGKVKDNASCFNESFITAAKTYGKVGGAGNHPSAYAGGGGGGAISGGSKAGSRNNDNKQHGGHGGAGLESNITGQTYTYGAGGGGGTGFNSDAECGKGGGKDDSGAGNGGNASGSSPSSGSNGGDALANQGGGGGGAGRYGRGGNGGSGVVVFRYVEKKIKKPVAISNLVYTGEVLEGVEGEGEGYTFLPGSILEATEVGTYTAVAKLNEGEKWADGSTDDHEITWKILPKLLAKDLVDLKNGYTVCGLGDSTREIAVVFTNESAEVINWTVPANLENVQFLAVGGGGGGGGASDTTVATGSGGAGGGGGAVVTGIIKNLDSGSTVNVVVGEGGEGGKHANSSTNGTGSAQSGFYTCFSVGSVKYITAYGGGGDNGFNQAVVGNGGSNPGARTKVNSAVDVDEKTVWDSVSLADKMSSVVALRKKGGYTYEDGDRCYNDYSSAGGGGADEEGYYPLSSSYGGSGGKGITLDITGSSVMYGSGGSGGCSKASAYKRVAPEGAGTGGGGSNSDIGAQGGSGLPNQGGGGGGGGYQGNGGKGGSGIVVFRFEYNEVASVDGYGYLDLDEAISAADAGDAVTLLANAGNIELGKSIALNLNGCTVDQITLTDAAVTLTAPEKLNVVTGVKDYDVVYADGVYSLQKVAVVQIGETTYATLAEAVAAAQSGDTIVLIENVELAETVTIPVGKTLTIDLNGKSISMEESIVTTAYALNNLGTLTLNDSVGTGSVNARGIYNGYGNGADNVATAKIIIQSGTYNAKGTNGGAAIFNYGIAEINGGSFTSIGGYSLNNQAGSSMTIADGVTANNGIYCSNAKVTVNGGNISGNRSGCHVVYAWNAELTINGGTFYNNNSGNATIMSAGTTKCTITGGTFGIKDGRVEGNGNTWTSCLTDTANTATMTVTGGIFNGGFRVQAGTTMTIEGGSFNDVGGSGYGIYGTASVKGGTFTDTTAQNFAKANLADGFELNVGGNVVEIPAVAQIGETKYATLSEAFAAVTDDAQTVTILKDVTENLTGAYLRGNITTENDAKVTINLTNSDWLYCPYTFVLGTNVTLKCPALFYYAGGAQINGKLIVDAYYQMYAGTKLTINEPGSMTVTTEQFYLRYTDGDTNAGIYINGDNDDSTIGLNTSVIYFYQGMINAKNANIKTSVYWQTNETDGQGSANLVLDNSTLNITSYENVSKATGNSTVTLNNGSQIITVLGFEGNASISIDITGMSAGEINAIKGNLANFTGEITTVGNDGLVAEIQDGKLVLVERGLVGSGTDADPFLIKSLADLVLFRDSVNKGETKYNAAGVCVELAADIDMAGENWVGIGSITQDHGFMGNFDGKTFKIKNLTINNPTLNGGYAYAGFFSITEGTETAQNIIKNLTIENVAINTTGHIVSAAIAYPYYTTVDNITVCGNIAIKGGNYTAGVLAYTRLCQKASNLTVAGNEGSYITGTQAVGGIMADIQMNKGLIADYANFSVSGVTITGTKMVGGIAGIIATQTLEGASVKNVTLVCEDSRVGIVAGSFGGTCTISGIVAENVTGATAVIGAAYDGAAAVQARIGDTFYATFAEALNAAKGGESVTLLANVGDVVLGKSIALDLNGCTIGEITLAGAGVTLTAPAGLDVVTSIEGCSVVYADGVYSLQPVTLPEVVITDIKSTLTDADPDLTFALNFAIKDVDKLSKEYLEKLFAKYGDYYTDYVLTISGLTDPNGSVKFNANGNGDGYLAGQYDAWSKNWVTVPFSDVTVKNGQSFYIMEYAAELMGKGGLRFTLKEIAEIVQNFDCGVYFTPEFLAANPNLKVELELKVFTEDESGNKVGDISVATNTFDKDDFSVEAAKLDIRIVNGKPQIGFAGEGKLVLNAATALTGEWTKNVEYTLVENDGDDTKTWVTPKDGYYFFKGYIVR